MVFSSIAVDFYFRRLCFAGIALGYYSGILGSMRLIEIAVGSFFVSAGREMIEIAADPCSLEIFRRILSSVPLQISVVCG